ncbi:MAG: hypothetical protein RL033_4391 [Pseudomonadota bacterium]|jgi:hypothetical protein
MSTPAKNRGLRVTVSARYAVATGCALLLGGGLTALLVAACGAGTRSLESLSPDELNQGVTAFATVQRVLQHPRCQNCHIPGDSPLQFDDGQEHAQGILRGPDGKGAPGLPCSSCHGTENAPASYGPHAPPGAPGWALPPPEHKMVTLGLSGAEVCAMLKDPAHNGGKDFDALIHHVSEDKLVLWGWSPGGQRAPVSVPHEEFVEQFKLWASLGGPCPAPSAPPPVPAPGAVATQPSGAATAQ